MIIPLADRSWPSVVAALDQSFRIIGGAPTYLLTDNEKTVTDHHIAGIPVRNRGAVDLSRYYGVTIATCVPYDPESKGGSERPSAIAKADLVPTEYNLLEDYRDFRRARGGLRGGGRLVQSPHPRRHPAGSRRGTRGGAWVLAPGPRRPLQRRLRRVALGRVVLGGLVPWGPLLVSPTPWSTPWSGSGRTARGGHRGR